MPVFSVESQSVPTKQGIHRETVKEEGGGDMEAESQSGVGDQIHCLRESSVDAGVRTFQTTVDVNREFMRVAEP